MKLSSKLICIGFSGSVWRYAAQVCWRHLRIAIEFSCVPLSETIVRGFVLDQDDVESSHGTQIREGCVDDQRQAFSREVVDNGRNMNPLPINEGIADNVEFPLFVGS